MNLPQGDAALAAAAPPLGSGDQIVCQMADDIGAFASMPTDAQHSVIGVEIDLLGAGIYADDKRTANPVGTAPTGEAPPPTEDGSSLCGDFPTIYEGVTFRALAYDALARGAISRRDETSAAQVPNLEMVLSIIHGLYTRGCLPTPIVRVYFHDDCRSIAFDSFTTTFWKSTKYVGRPVNMDIRAEARAKAGSNVPLILPETVEFGRFLKNIDHACKHMISFGTDYNAVGPMKVGAAVQWLDATLASVDRPPKIDIFYRDRAFVVPVTSESTGAGMLQQLGHECNMQIARTLAIEKLEAASICDQQLLDVCDVLGVAYPK